MIDNLIYSRLQHRRGTRRDLPQPLLPGEFGFCTDTLQLFIGSDPNDTTSSLIPTIRLYNDYYQTFKYGIDNSISETSAHEVIQLIYSVIFPRLQRISPPSGIVPETDRFYPVNETYGYVALGFPDSGYPYDVLTWDKGSLLFSAGEMKLNGLAYSHSDASAIAKAINYAAEAYSLSLGNTGPLALRNLHLRKGVVTTALNVEIHIKDANSYEDYLGTIEVPLLHSGESVWSMSVPVTATGMVIDVDEVDNLVIKYSISGRTSSDTVYRRAGNMNIMYDGTGFMIDDQYSVSNNIVTPVGEAELAIDFSMNHNTGGLEYRMYGATMAGTSFNMRLNTLKWRSF